MQIWRISAAGPSPEVADLQARFRRVGLTVGSIVLLIVYLSIGLTRGSGAIVASDSLKVPGCHERNRRAERPDWMRRLTALAIVLGVIATLSYGTGAHMAVRYLNPSFGAWWNSNEFAIVECAAAARRNVDRNSHRRAAGAWRAS